LLRISILDSSGTTGSSIWQAETSTKIFLGDFLFCEEIQTGADCIQSRKHGSASSHARDKSIRRITTGAFAQGKCWQDSMPTKGFFAPLRLVKATG